MFNLILDSHHVWQNKHGNVLVSDESVKALRQYATMDDAINGLYVSGHQMLARAIHTAYKAYSAKQGA